MNPVFLVGAEQSGTTLLRLMLDSHPEVAFAEEFHPVVDAIGDDGLLPDVESLHSSPAFNRFFSSNGFRIDSSLDYEELVNGFLVARQQAKEALVVGATIHRGFAKVLRIWPEARFLHLVRDPRDVAVARMATGLSGNPWHAVAHWIRCEDEWSVVESAVSADRRLTMRFDQLIGDHHSALTKICNFIGVDYTAQMLNYARDTDYREPSLAVAGDWRDSLSTRDVQLVETRVGDRLTAWGFERSGTDPLEISDRYLGWLRWQDRAGRIGARVQRYGVRLTMAELAAQAVGTESMQRSLQQRLSEAEMEQRKQAWSDQEDRTSS